MKKLFTFLFLMIISIVSYGQKPMVGFTEDDIKTYNRIQNETFFWDKIYESNIWCLWTKHQTLDLMSFYVFEYGKNKNTMFVNATKDDELALIILDKIREDCVFLGNDRYFNKDNGLTVKCEYNQSEKSFMFKWFFE